MSTRPTEELIETLAAAPAPVQPLAPPARRALQSLAILALLGVLAVVLMADPSFLLARARAAPVAFALEQLAMLATAALAVAGAFHLSIPGRSRRWLIAPLPPLAVWLMLSGLGCTRFLAGSRAPVPQVGHDVDCLVFIVAAGAAIGLPLLWRLSRAAPIDPLPVALLGGLGSAALSAFLLQFFHPFDLTLLDLAVHLAAILFVIGLAALLRRPMLRPA
jgi:hypothetical protein